MPESLSAEEIAKLNEYWFAANYLTVGQIYLRDNPLLERPLAKEDIKPRLLGHWGTTAGLNFIYTHLNRLIRRHDLNMMYIIGPGHGGPGMVAHTYLEGTYTEIYPNIEQNRDGIKRLFRQFSWPYGIPSHVAPETPGSIHEGGELGYSLLHAYGAAFDNPDLIVACIVGDGEAETGACAASWHSNKFLNPAKDGAVLPILHLNGFKIANPTVLARISEEELRDLFIGYGYEPKILEGDDPAKMHPAMAATLEDMLAEIRAIQERARGKGEGRAPALAFADSADAKRLDRTKRSGRQTGRRNWRAHQVPIADVVENPEHLQILEELAEELQTGKVVRQRRTVPAGSGGARPTGDRRMGMNPACQRRQAARAAGAAGFSAVCGNRKPGRWTRRQRAFSAISARCHEDAI